MDKIAAVILREIARVRQDRDRVLIAIDGRCAAGKSTLAQALKERLSCDVFHMDDFFLRPEQRTQERYGEPGGNVDRERFAAEVLLPWRLGNPFVYRPFDCKTMALRDPIAVEPAALAIVEGTYSCHPMLWDSYDLHIFLTVPPEEQIARLIKRDRKTVDLFRERWIPLEERYFSACSIEEKCELSFSTALACGKDAQTGGGRYGETV